MPRIQQLQQWISDDNSKACSMTNQDYLLNNLHSIRTDLLTNRRMLLRTTNHFNPTWTMPWEKNLHAQICTFKWKQITKTTHYVDMKGTRISTPTATRMCTVQYYRHTQEMVHRTDMHFLNISRHFFHGNLLDSWKYRHTHWQTWPVSLNMGFGIPRLITNI